MMKDTAWLDAHRAHTFRLQPARRVTTRDHARAFVHERGFIFFWPITDVTLPSLWVSVAGDRPVPDAHDDPGHITWGWKDQALDKRWWYYGKILRGRATLIDLAVAPYFYALSENYGAPTADYLDQYRDGLLSHDARLIYETLLEKGPLDTVNLRRQIHMTSAASNSPFERALVSLQRDFKILPVGVAQTGAWRYSFIYECAHRWYPDLPAQAQAISRSAARARLVELYFQAVGAATAAAVRAVFQWPAQDIAETIAALIAAQKLEPARALATEGPEWLAVTAALA